MSMFYMQKARPQVEQLAAQLKQEQEVKSVLCQPQTAGSCISKAINWVAYTTTKSIDVDHSMC